jgi:hypothetical protein
MKKFIVIILLVFIGVGLAIIGLVLYESKFSSDAVVGKMNLKNLEHVHIGMDSILVKEIMGAPDNRNSNEKGIFFNYKVPPGQSVYCTIGFDSDGKVNFINPNREELKHFNF